MKIILNDLVRKVELGIASKTSFVTWTVFLATLIVLFFTLIPAVFPALLLTSFGGFKNFAEINPFEIGIFAYPLLVTNLVVLSIGVLYYKNRLWQPIRKSFRFIYNFEVSKRVAFFVIVILIGVYVTFSVTELFDGKYQADFNVHFKDWLELYSISKFDITPIGYHAQFFLETTSLQLFDNYKVIPFIASIALLVLTYFLTAELSKKRFAGLVAMVIVLQSNVFLMYDTSVSYPNFWILFYLFSLYLILKKWPLSPISYIASVLSKPLTAAFLPMTFFFIYRTNYTIKKKIYIIISYGVIVVVGIIFLTNTNTSLIENLEFNSHDFWMGFNAVYTALRFDGLVLFFLLPLIVGLFYISRRGMPHADSIMFLIFGILMSAPFVQGFSDVINVPYRFIPLIVFFAIGTGMLLSRQETKLS